MLSLVIIGILGGALVLLSRLEPEVEPVGDDLWSAFAAAEDTAALNEDELHLALARAMQAAGSSGAPADQSTAVGVWAPGTVGAMRTGDHGFVNARAAMLDIGGGLWLAAAAVVHTTRRPGHVAVRRDLHGYHLQRHDGPVGLWDGITGPRGNGRVRIAGRFD